jgi:hypothetical protein
LVLVALLVMHFQLPDRLVVIQSSALLLPTVAVVAEQQIILLVAMVEAVAAVLALPEVEQETVHLLAHLKEIMVVLVLVEGQTSMVAQEAGALLRLVLAQLEMLEPMEELELLIAYLDHQ